MGCITNAISVQAKGQEPVPVEEAHDAAEKPARPEEPSDMEVPTAAGESQVTSAADIVLCHLRLFMVFARLCVAAMGLCCGMHVTPLSRLVPSRRLEARLQLRQSLRMGLQLKPWL